MASENISDLNVVLRNYLGDDKELKGFEMQRFTKVGDNYGSLILSIDLKILNKRTGTEENVNVVAKKVPLSEFMQKAFQSPLTFKKELGFYQKIVPEFQNFQKSYGDNDLIDFFPKCYGGRLGLQDEVFDNEAIILLENLKLSGYKSIKRTHCYNLEEAKLILKHLALLHALPICIKSKNPDLFNKELLPLMNIVNTFSSLDPSFKNNIYEQIVECVKDFSDISGYAEKVLEHFKYAEIQNFKTTPREPFASLVHADLWTSNILLKYENSHPKDVKIIDFQLFHYGNLAKDLSFLMFVNFDNDVIQNQYDKLLEHYLQHFTDYLKHYDVDSTPFTRAALDEAMASAVRESTFFQCLMMLYPIFATDENLIDIDRASAEEMASMGKTEVPPLHKEKLYVILKEFIKHGWL